MNAPGSRRANAEPRWLRLTLTGLGLGFLFFFLALPLMAVAVAGLAAHPWTLVAGAAFRRAAITSFSIASVAATLALLLLASRCASTCFCPSTVAAIKVCFSSTVGSVSQVPSVKSFSTASPRNRA